MGHLTCRRWLLAAALALLVPSTASAAGLGRLTVLSGLGQPLNAEVELLNVQKGETITGRVAPLEVYQQANLSYNPALVGARVTLERRSNGQSYLKVTSSRPVTEPFAEVLVEVNSEHGKITRQYTVLLDPPGYGRAAGELPPPPPTVSAPPPRSAAPAQQSAPLAAAAPVAPAPTESGATGRAAAPQTPSQPRAAPPPSRPAAARQYGPVKPGETLGGIARTVQPEGATLEQTLVGLYRHNPDAFIKKNMNLVKSGRILTVPEANELANVAQREAVREVRLQSADFNAFRNRVADQAPAAPEDGNVASGRIGSRVSGREPSEARDTVRVSRGETGDKGGNAERLRALEEEAVAREKSLADANERIAQLEKTIKDMQRLAEMKSASATAPGAPAAAVPQAAKAPETGPDPAGAGGPEVAAGAADPAATAAGTPAAESRGESIAPVASAPAVPPAPADEDFVDTLLSEPLYLAAGGAVVVLGGLAFVAARRRRAGQRYDGVRVAPTLASGGTPLGSSPAPVSPAAPAAKSTTSPPPPPAPTPADRSPAPRAEAPPAVAAAARTGAGAATRGPGGSAEDNDLDFDAGMRTTTPTRPEPPAPGAPPPRREAPVAAAAPPQAPPRREAPIVPERTSQPSALDPNLGSRSKPEPTPTVTPTPPAPHVRPLDAPPAAPSGSAAAAEHSLPDFALDPPSSASPGVPQAGEQRASAAADFNMDFNLEPLPPIDLPDLKAETPKPSSPPAGDLDFKLGELSLDFGRDTAAGAAPTSPAPTPLKDDHWYDVQQKFDLAKAYEEMGDKSGAREILEEVLKEGDADQQAQAKKVLATLS